MVRGRPNVHGLDFPDCGKQGLNVQFHLYTNLLNSDFSHERGTLAARAREAGMIPWKPRLDVASSCCSTAILTVKNWFIQEAAKEAGLEVVCRS